MAHRNSMKSFLFLSCTFLLVSIDAHGRNLYFEVKAEAKKKLDAMF